MYVMFVDESGTHGNSPVFILGAVAVHESHLTQAHDLVGAVAEKAIRPRGLDPDDFELHGAEIKSPPVGKGKKKDSPWRAIPNSVRGQILSDAMDAVAGIRCRAAGHGCGLFGVAVDARFRAGVPLWEREQIGYEHLLKKFDDMLQRHGSSDLGFVIHDNRLVVENDVRRWTQDWRDTAGRIGKLEAFAHVPLFADSKGSRLLQAADLVSYALWRLYSIGDTRYIDKLWDAFDGHSGLMHGAVHLTPNFYNGGCTCRPCTRRHTPPVHEAAS